MSPSASRTIRRTYFIPVDVNALTRRQPVAVSQMMLPSAFSNDQVQAIGALPHERVPSSVTACATRTPAGAVQIASAAMPTTAAGSASAWGSASA